MQGHKGLNFAASVSPAYNVLRNLAHAKSLGGAPLGVPGLSGSMGSGATPAAQAVEAQNQATQYRPPTQKYERSIFGNSFRDTTPEDRQQYNQAWRSDRRNQGYGGGQVDPGLARAANQQDSGGEGGK